MVAKHRHFVEISSGLWLASRNSPVEIRHRTAFRCINHFSNNNASCNSLFDQSSRLVSFFVLCITVYSETHNGAF